MLVVSGSERRGQTKNGQGGESMIGINQFRLTTAQLRVVQPR